MVEKIYGWGRVLATGEVVNTAISSMNEENIQKSTEAGTVGGSEHCPRVRAGYLEAPFVELHKLSFDCRSSATRRCLVRGFRDSPADFKFGVENIGTKTDRRKQIK